jgi:hypothetical protein
MASNLRKKSRKQAFLIIFKSAMCELLGHNRRNLMPPEVVLYFFNDNKKSLFRFIFFGDHYNQRNFWKEKKHFVKYVFEDYTGHPSWVKNGQKWGFE